MRFFVIVLWLIASIVSVCSAEIQVISKIPSSSSSHQLGVIFVKKLNTIQNKHTFTISSLTGANGLVPDMRVLDLARSGKSAILFGPLSTFTIGRFENENAFDRDKDYLFLTSVTSTYFSLISTVDSIDELLLRMGNKGYYGISFNGGMPNYLIQAFLKHQNLKSEAIKYPGIAEISRALLVGEIDFTVVSHTNILTFKELNNSKTNLANIKGFTDTSLTIFAIPKELSELKTDIQPYFDKVCRDQEILEYVRKMEYSSSCLRDKELYDVIDGTLKNIGTYR